MSEPVLIALLLLGLVVAVHEVYRHWRDRLCPRCGGVMRWEQFSSDRFLYCRGCAWREEGR